jgi:hypothetical protein
MNPLLEQRLLATRAYYKRAEIHTNACQLCMGVLLENTLKRWEHMTKQTADRRGSLVDRATRLGLTAMYETENHTNSCDLCLDISITSFEERFAHSREAKGETK